MSQYGGVVVRVGDRVDSLVPGDRVVVMASGHCATHERVAAWACQKLDEDEDFSVRATRLLYYYTDICYSERKSD